MTDTDSLVDLDDDIAETDDESEFEDGGCAERVLDVCVRSIVDDPGAIEIDIEEAGNRLILHVRVAPDDMGKIIGKRGRVANALRTVVKAAGGRDGISATVEIED